MQKDNDGGATSETATSTMTLGVRRPYPQMPSTYSILVFVLSCLYAVVTVLPSLLTVLIFGPPNLSPNSIQSQSSTIINSLATPVISLSITISRWLIFFAIFYYLIGKRIDFERNHGKLAILTVGGLMTFYAFVIFSYSTTAEVFSSSLLQQDVSYVVSAVASFGVLFGALSLAFIRTQLPLSDSPPLELVAYRRPSFAGAIAFLTSFGSPVLSGFVAAFLYQQGLLRGDQFSFLRYYFSGFDPLLVNYIVYPGLFVLLLYFLGGKVEFGRDLGRVSLYLFVGGFVGYLLGSPLGNYLRVFFNPPSTSLSSSAAASIAQLYAFNVPLLYTSILEAALLTLLGISILTVALLRRQSDLPKEDDAIENEEDDGDE